MTLGDLETVVQYKLPIKIIVFNNRSLWNGDSWKWKWTDCRTGKQYAESRLCPSGEAMGMAGFNVSDPEEVLTTLLNAFELDGPVLVIS
jgi:pyruvate dehydrogenase (quinone)